MDRRSPPSDLSYIHLAAAQLAMGLTDQSTAAVSWKAALDALSSHGTRYEILGDIYFTAVARPDLWPTFASFARDLLDLPEERLASFRDVAPPAELLELFRPFAEGAITEPYDPRNPLYQPSTPSSASPKPTRPRRARPHWS
ncbi:MAG: hypothetical protein HC897_16185, partial [Thermoanaerobaculia bacterium]|nr:hypothetical protein [Thermoanaerobaculia bacterium]